MTDGTAVVYCNGAFDSTYGKTAHGLVRFTERYRVAYVIDSSLSGRDAGQVLDGSACGIRITGSLDEALELAEIDGGRLSHFVIGVATDGGYLDDDIRSAAAEAVDRGLNVDSGLHEYISDIDEIRITAERKGLAIRDIRKAAVEGRRFFTGAISGVGSKRIAILGTDSAVGKRTTAWKLVHALRTAGKKTELIGTGQTAWMQGARFGIILDSIINDYVSGELEHAVCSAWDELKPDFLVIEGQGSIMNPAYPGGFEILAAARPDGIVMQHAPMRKDYDGFPGYPLDPLEQQIRITEMLSKKPVIAVAVNHEGLPRESIDEACEKIEKSTGLPVIDPLVHRPDRLVEAVLKL